MRGITELKVEWFVSLNIYLYVLYTVYILNVHDSSLRICWWNEEN